MLGDIPLLLLSTKILDFVNLIKILLVLILFIQRADNLAHFMGTRKTFTFDN